MKNNNVATFIIIASVIIITVFTSVCSYEFLKKNETDPYYSQVVTGKEPQIVSITSMENSIVVRTKNAEKICVKTTVSKPKANSMCWEKVENNVHEASLIININYYVWVMNEKGEIFGYRN